MSLFDDQFSASCSPGFQERFGRACTHTALDGTQTALTVTCHGVDAPPEQKPTGHDELDVVEVTILRSELADPRVDETLSFASGCYAGEVWGIRGHVRRSDVHTVVRAERGRALQVGSVDAWGAN